MSWIKDYIDEIVDFPSNGIKFKDITPLLESEKFTGAVKELIANTIVDWEKVDCIAGIESRGFIFASAMAVLLGKGVILIRKKGKLPPPVVVKLCLNEYANEVLEVKKKETKKTIVIVDDVLATGGTLKASYELCESANYKVAAISVLIDLSYLHPKDYKVGNINVDRLLTY